MKRKYNMFNSPITRHVNSDIKHEFQVIHNYCKDIATWKTFNANSIVVNIMELLDVAIHRWNRHHSTKLAYYTVGGGVVLHNNKGGECRYVTDITDNCK